jgi:hypothetical protein
MKLRFCIVIFIIAITCIGYSNPAHAWGTFGHARITSSAIEDLPLEMATVFRPYKQWISDSSTDAGVRTGWAANESYFHYIDADYLPANQWPFNTVPRIFSVYTAQYGVSQGICCYEVDTLTLVLSTAYRNWMNNKTGSNFTTAMIWMFRISHYTADLDQPLHVTYNYDSMGSHSRYETTMLTRFTPTISSTLNSGTTYYSNPLEFAFSLVSASYPYIATIYTADSIARKLDSSYGNTYYNSLWGNTSSFTIKLLNKAAVDVASIWYTAWTNAKSMPVPVELSEFIVVDEAIEPGRNHY